MAREMDGTFEKVAFEANNMLLLYINRQNVNYDTHWHAAAEIIMPIENDYSVTINNRVYMLGERDILFIPPGELHALEAPATGSRLIMMFDFSVFNSMDDFTAISPVLSQPILITEDAYPDIHEREVTLLQQSIKEYENRSATMRVAMIYSYLIQFFANIGRRHIRTNVIFPDVRAGKQMEYVEKLNNVITYINTNYVEEITLEKAASIAGFSKFHFSRLFKQFTGQSYYNFLNQRRVKAAEALLLNPHLSVTDVAMQSGFTSIATFNRVFRQAKDCTPSEYKVFYHRRSRIR